MKISLYIAVSFLIVCLFNRPALLIPPEVQGFFSSFLTNKIYYLDQLTQELNINLSKN